VSRLCNVGASTSHNPVGLYGLSQGYPYVLYLLPARVHKAKLPQGLKVTKYFLAISRVHSESTFNILETFCLHHVRACSVYNGGGGDGGGDKLP
jgi:hypothetical protein